MTRYDRDELLARIDLRALADDLLGNRQGSERSPMWPCPVPTHGQTGRTPPLSVFVTRWGEQRWRCHGCGASGSAIDLVIHSHGLDVRTAIEWLAHRTALQPQQSIRPPRRSRNPALRVTREPDPGIDTYVTACEALLWSPTGRGPARWLTEKRGLSEEILRLNRVGFDPGARHLDRPDGVPKSVGVVLPVLDDTGQAIFTQTRRLGPRLRGPRYLNCAAQAAPNPRVAFYRTHSSPSGSLVVCEGTIDALTVADAHLPSAAVLGSSLADENAAATLTRRSTRVVIGFDADDAGDRGAAELARLITEAGGTTIRLRPPPELGDLNAWRISVGHRWANGVRPAVEPPFRMRSRSAEIRLA